MLFTVILLPVLQSFNFCFGIGVDFKNMPIAFQNDEVNYEYCKNYNIKGCIFDESNNETMSCVVLDYFASHNYKLVSSLFSGPFKCCAKVDLHVILRDGVDRKTGTL